MSLQRSQEMFTMPKYQTLCASALNVTRQLKI